MNSATDELGASQDVASARLRTEVGIYLLFPYCSRKGRLSFMARATFRERYPPPWRVEEMPGGYRVLASNGIAVVYVYSVDGIVRSASPNSLTHSEASCVARAICLLPTLTPDST